MYDIFEIDTGTKLDKAKMDTTNPKINFVGRSNFNNGITQKVNEIKELMIQTLFLCPQDLQENE